MVFKKTNNTNNVTQIFGVKLTIKDKELLRAEAKKNRLTMCAYVRYIIFKDINKNEGNI